MTDKFNFAKPRNPPKYSGTKTTGEGSFVNNYKFNLKTYLRSTKKSNINKNTAFLNPFLNYLISYFFNIIGIAFKYNF